MKKKSVNNLFFFFRIILFTLIYFSIAKMSLSFATIHNAVSPIWPPTGFAIGLLYLMGLKYLPAISIGVFIVNYSLGSSLPAVFAIAIGNSLEAAVGVYLYRWLNEQTETFGIHKRTFAFILTAALSAAISACIGISSLCLFESASWRDFDSLALTWWTGNAMGTILFFPMMLALSKTKFRKIPLAIALVVSGVGISWLVMMFPQGAPYLFILFVYLFLSVNVAGEAGALSSITTVLVVALYSISNGNGVFFLGSSNSNLVHFQLFFSSLCITGFFLIDYKNEKIFKSLTWILMGGWLLSGILFAGFYLKSLQLSEAEFNTKIEKLEAYIQSKMERNITALQSGAGLFAAKKSITHEEWKSFFEQLNLDVNLHGLLGLGKITRVDKKNLDHFFFEMKRNGQTEAHYKSLGADDLADAYIINLIEPISRNAPAIGLDVGSEKNRREAAELSRDSGTPAITNSILLVQDNKKRAGFLMFYPLYAGLNTPTTLEEKRSKLVGWIYTPVILENFFSSIFKNKEFEDLTYLVKGSDEENDKTFAMSRNFNLYSRNGIKKRSIKMLNQIYNFEIGTTKNGIASADSLPSWVAAFTSLLTLIVAAFVANSLTLGTRAQALAKKMTLELRSNAELIEKQQMKLIQSSKMSSLGEMASGIAHEINNPLTVINSKLLILEKNLNATPLDVNKIREHIKQIERTTLRIAKIVKGLSAFSRNTEDDPMEPAILTQILEDTLELCRERFINQNMAIKINIQKPVSVLCRPHQLSQVLMNLFSNAYDAIVNQEDKWIAVDVFSEANFVKIRITDSGPGIPEEITEKMMEPFFTTKEVGKGTGLGLSISKGIIEEHGGHFSYDKTSGHTSFVIELPIIS